MDIVFLAPKPSLDEASCCRVEVINGIYDARFLLFLTIELSLKSSVILSSILLASSSFLISALLPSILFNVHSIFESRPALMVQYSSGTKALTSFSRSQIILRATDCTLPADLDLIFFCKSFDSLKPIILSSILLVSWDLTRFISMVLGFSRALVTAVLVISLKTIRLVFSTGRSST